MVGFRSLGNNFESVMVALKFTQVPSMLVIYGYALKFTQVPSMLWLCIEGYTSAIYAIEQQWSLVTTSNMLWLCIEVYTFTQVPSFCDFL